MKGREKMTDDADVTLPATTPIPTRVVREVSDFVVVATTPAEMTAAQQSLIVWAQDRIAAEKELMDDAIAQFDIAKKNKWNASGWQSRIAISEKKIVYYSKIRLALEAGYYIVPPFPIDIFAIRTDAKGPGSRWGWEDINLAQEHGVDVKALVAGVGEYVSNKTWTRPFKKMVRNVLDKYEEKTFYKPSSFRQVEFPFKLAKATVMSETARAMALKVFDQIGIMGTAGKAVTHALPDPIVCGQIMPWHGSRQPVTFFIAWWLDTKTL